MPARTYGQLCPIARSLDVLGDRWTLLVVRELLLGEKRFGELLAMLPAMGTNRLADRLTLLCENGIVEKTQPTTQIPGGAYKLTAFGEGLRKPILDLALWGMALTSYEDEDLSSARAELVALGLSAAVDPLHARDFEAVVGFEVGSEIFHVHVRKGVVRVRSGASSAPPDAIARCPLSTFLDLAFGRLRLSQAMSQGDIELVDGSRKALARFFALRRHRLANA